MFGDNAVLYKIQARLLASGTKEMSVTGQILAVVVPNTVLLGHVSGLLWVHSVCENTCLRCLYSVAPSDLCFIFSSTS